ncbi:MULTISPECIES: Ig-like domain-containing protein [unclassified Janthinobacterium]|uniref:Ig-like domain-containing protein n=1 Tax=unclassified Janthinobacterium TaxID=2610881 RepID=UPI00160CD5C4|nr:MULTISPECIES: Ig-like domain-containing protein [unclassified Janthinobacterium]MBB5609191.1 hypothetical protein [Janthinobacterium sp. S3T4]MBB5614364.1 hypothetical protein [Janthinobacterium sp. S3M3]
MRNKPSPVKFDAQFHEKSPMKNDLPARKRLAMVLALLMLPAVSQAQMPLPDSVAGPSLAPPTLFNDRIGAVDYSINRGIARIVVDTDQSDVPADGQSAVTVRVTLFDEQGQPVKGPALLTLEASGGRILLPGARTDELGPEARDADKVTPGTQLKVENSVASFSLIAPGTPQDVLLRVSAGSAAAQGVISFLPELRDMLAVGLIDGIISKRSLSSSSISPSRFNDGFERDIDRWSRSFNNGKANVAGRAAMFLKGTIRGDALLTAAYDSDKDTRSRLLRDVNPEEFYPVYGDSSIRNFDARSSDRLYVRIDKEKSYVLYGDFATGEGFSQMTGGGNVATLQQRKLGQYNRTATGGRGHYEKEGIVANVFAINDSLKQVIEEYQANGTSGPFAVRNNNGIENSEKIEIVVRDKNQNGNILQVTQLQRFEDYSFEPFSGRILFKQAIPALTAAGNPQSIRISYEVDQGGEKFWTVGADGQLQLNKMVSLGGAIVEDKNPLSPYKLHSVNAGLRLGDNTLLVVEAARTTSTSYSAGGGIYTTPSGQAGEMRDDVSGNAARVELQHKDDKLEARAYWSRSDTDFNNTAAGITGGRGETGLKAGYKINPAVTVYGEAIRSDERSTEAHRDAARLGVAWNASERWLLDVSLQHIKESGGLPSTAGIAPNTAPLGTGLNPVGGFYGNGTANTAIDPVTGSSITTFAPINPGVGGGTSGPLDATTVRLGTQYKATDRWTLNGEVEKSVSDTDQHRYALGAQYQLAERSRLYGRYENQTGLASAYSLNPADRSTSFIAGVDTGYMPGGTVFGEYRMRDALDYSLSNQRDLQLASGLRNTWNLSEGLAASTNVEYLKVINGQQQQAVAVAAGLDYSANPLWRASVKLEYRRLFDSKIAPGDQSQDQWLNTIAWARKLSRDWTFLARNYLLYTRNNDDASGAPIGNVLQDRAQLGFAWRPVDNNRYNGLARYEYKTVRDKSQLDGDNYRAHIVSTHLDYHPSRPWWFTGRVAAKHNNDKNLPAGQEKYTAWLFSGRTVYDISKNWDIGVLTAVMGSPQGGSRQWANGLEVGYLLAQNLWLSAGHNWSGFTDRDLTGADYTARGPYLRLRFKFDEKLFKGKDPVINRTLARP